MEDKRCVGDAFTVNIMVGDDIHCCNRSLDYHCSLGCKFQQLLFSLDLDSPSFLLGCPVLGMEFWVKPPTFGLPMSSQFAVLAIVLAWAAWPYRVPTITSLMTHFLAT
jgi:hypothetical protein